MVLTKIVFGPGQKKKKKSRGKKEVKKQERKRKKRKNKAREEKIEEVKTKARERKENKNTKLYFSIYHIMWSEIWKAGKKSKDLEKSSKADPDTFPSSFRKLSYI